MTEKRKTNTAAPAPSRNVVMVALREAAESHDKATARELTRPEVQAAAVIQQFQGDNQDVNALIRELETQVSLVHDGNLGRAEAMLLAQAHTLEEVFSSLMRRSHANMAAGYTDACERYMRLALKAQSQCRTTLEALAEIKNPRPVAFVRQANIAHGPQQVNNSPSSGNSSREKSENQSNELSGKANELLPDSRTSAGSIGPNKAMETVGQIYGTKDERRESQERPE